MIDIEYYKFENGTNPIDPYLDSLKPKMRSKVFRAMALLEEFGTDLRMPHSEYLTDGIFELRAKMGSDLERVLFFFYSGHKAIMTNGFTKKQQKTPKKELEIAKSRKADYERKHSDERL